MVPFAASQTKCLSPTSIQIGMRRRRNKPFIRQYIVPPDIKKRFQKKSVYSPLRFLVEKKCFRYADIA
jgi:hypothetical protein